MGVGLVARAAQIEPDHAVGIEDPEDVIALGREVDPPVRRRGGGEEDGLAGDEGDMILGEMIGEVRHAPLFPF